MQKYIFNPYNKLYPELYQNEERKLNEALGNDILIEHIGSTAVPGLGGKGIIDIMIAVFREQMEKYSGLVQKAGYEYKVSGGNEERIFYQRDVPDKKNRLIRYHLHLTFPESSSWMEALAFRDYLRSHPDEVEKYAEIKKKAALESDQTKEKYMAIKEPIIQDILKKALREVN